MQERYELAGSLEAVEWQRYADFSCPVPRHQRQIYLGEAGLRREDVISHANGDLRIRARHLVHLSDLSRRPQVSVELGQRPRSRESVNGFLIRANKLTVAVPDEQKATIDFEVAVHQLHFHAGRQAELGIRHEAGIVVRDAVVF